MDASKLKRYLECPVCFSVPRNKIFACSNSHKICEACFTDKLRPESGVKQCPQGSCVYDNPPRRNRDLEAIIENSDVKLSCTQPKCNVKMIKSKLMYHEKNQCEFRKVPCPVTYCQTEKVLRYLDIHLQIRHKIQTCSEPVFVIQESFDSDGDSRGFPSFLWIKDRVEFYPQLVERGGFWYFWMKVKGGLDVATQWRFSVKIENKNTGIRMEFSGAISPVDMTAEEVIEDGDCLQMNKTNVHKLRDEKEHISFSFKVFKVGDDDNGMDEMVNNPVKHIKGIPGKLLIKPGSTKRRIQAVESESSYEEGCSRGKRLTRSCIKANGRSAKYKVYTDSSDDTSSDSEEEEVNK